MGRAKKDTEKQLSLTAERLEKYATFRHNLAVLRALKGIGSEELGRQMKFKKHYRAFDLERGRATAPKLEEVITIAAYFEITIDQLLNQKISAKLSFE